MSPEVTLPSPGSGPGGGSLGVAAGGVAGWRGRLARLLQQALDFVLRRAAVSVAFLGCGGRPRRKAADRQRSVFRLRKQPLDIILIQQRFICHRNPFLLGKLMKKGRRPGR